MSKPFTYFLKWTHLNKWYYGVRYAEGCDPSDLFTKYFTSSKEVKQYVKQFGLPNIIEIRKIFDDAQKAKNWETKVLQRMKVLYREDSLNKNDNLNPPLMRGKLNPMYGKILLQETKDKISNTLKGRTVYKDSFGNYFHLHINDPKIITEKLVHVAKGRKRTKEQKEKYSASKQGDKNHFFGKLPHNAINGWSDETKTKIKKSLEKLPKLECPHCGKIMNIPNAKKYHFDKCKLKSFIFTSC